MRSNIPIVILKTVVFDFKYPKKEIIGISCSIEIVELWESEIKNQLEYFRKKKEKEINYGHNPLNVKNVTNKCDWEVLKEQNLFNKNKNIFKNQKRIY